MLNDNLVILREYYLDLYEKILKEEDIDELQETVSKNGNPNLIINDNIWIHSRYNPEDEALKWVDSISVKDEDTILVIGLGLGYYLKYLVEKYRDKKLIIIEPNLSIFKEMLKFNYIGEYLKSENIVFMVDIDTYTVRKLITEYLYENKIKKIYFAEMSIYKKINNEYIKEIYDQINKGLFMLKSNIITEISFGEMWLNNTIRLLEYIKVIPNVCVMKEQFKNIPVVIVSAGPSLKKNVQYLKEIYDRALIIAVGSAVNILEKNNITPHIIMGLDGQEKEAKLFQSLKSNKSIFVFGSSIHYKAIQNYKGLKMSLILNTDKTMIELYKKLGIEIYTFSCGPSVSNVALAFAHYLQASQILLIGQDLAYTDNTRYAEGGIHNENIEDNELFKLKRYKKRKDIYGNEVYTKGDLIGIKMWFDDYIKLFSKEIEVYNCTEGGLGIEGVQNITFKDAIEKYCTNKYDIYNKLVSLAKQDSLILEDKFNGLLSKYKDETEKLIKLSENRLKKIYSLIKEYGNVDFKNELKKILILGEEIEEYEVYKIFIFNTAKVYINTITTAINNKLDKLDNIYDKNKVILDALIMQYEYIHKCLLIVKYAFDNKDVKYVS